MSTLAETNAPAYGSMNPTNNNSNDEEDQQKKQLQEQSTDYELGQSFYLTDSDETKRRKCLGLLLPLFIFTLIMGGIAFTMFKDFNRLYPGSGGGGEVHGDDHEGHSVLYEPSSPSEKTTSTTTTTTKVHHSSNANSSSNQRTGTMSSTSDCSLHSKCANLGLTGQCCPTTEGVTLGCC